MLYFLLTPILVYNWILIAAAVIPAVILMIKIYASDRLEKESTGLLVSLIEAGILSALLASVEERLGQFLLGLFVSPDSPAYNIIMFFVIVAVAEESSKYLFMKRRTWNDREFNCRYDGVVYALFTSLGFALWENISYVLSYGFSTALVRAVTAIPGHASFGVFMGIFYGLAKGAENRGNFSEGRLYRVLSILVPALLHGAYDYIATQNTEGGSYLFLLYIAALFFVAYTAVTRASRTDHLI